MAFRSVITISTFVLLLSFAQPAFSEYRVYQLKISDIDGEVVRIVLTTMDHLQYPTYYPLYLGETIEYIDSWMCFNRGDHFKKYCENPKTQTDAKLRFPSTEDPDTANNPIQ